MKDGKVKKGPTIVNIIDVEFVAAKFFYFVSAIKFSSKVGELCGITTVDWFFTLNGRWYDFEPVSFCKLLQTPADCMVEKTLE